MRATMAWQHLDRVLQGGQTERKGWLSVGGGRASTAKAREEDQGHPKEALVRTNGSQMVTNRQHIYKKCSASPAVGETQVKPHEIPSSLRMVVIGKNGECAYHTR